MFKSIKNIFKAKKAEATLLSEFAITFSDLIAQPIKVELRVSGDKNNLAIINDNTKNEFIFDSEQATILAEMFAEFSKTNNLNNFAKLIFEEGSNK